MDICLASAKKLYLFIKNMSRISEAEIFRFVELYKQQCLWNMKNYLNKNKQARDVAYNRMLQQTADDNLTL